MSTVKTQKARKSAGQEAQSALEETIKDINQAIKSGHLTASKSTYTALSEHNTPPAFSTKTSTPANDAFEVAYDSQGRVQVISIAGGNTITARHACSDTNIVSRKATPRGTSDSKAQYQHSKLKGLDINLLNLDEKYQEVSYEIKVRERRAVVTEVANGDKNAELYLGKRAKPRHMLLTSDGTQVIEGVEGRLTIDPTLTKFLMQSKDTGSIFVDLSINKMHITFPDGLKQTYGVTTTEAALLRQGPVGFKINWILDNNGNHRFQWSAIVAYSKLPN